MTDVVWQKINPKNALVSEDGLITDVNTTELGNADTSFTYFDLGNAGYNAFTLQYLITATTLTFEGTNDTPDIPNNSNEMITATNDRTFAGAGNWVADVSGDTATVSGGVLQVTGGARLEQEYFRMVQGDIISPGFNANTQYTIGFGLANLAGTTVSIYAGNVLIASGLTNGAGQTVTFRAPNKHLRNIRFVGSVSDTFDLDNVTITPVSATWTDITLTVTAGSAATITTSSAGTVSVPLPWSRMRVRRLTTNATNALELRLTRMKI